MLLLLYNAIFIWRFQENRKLSIIHTLYATYNKRPPIPEKYFLKNLHEMLYVHVNGSFKNEARSANIERANNRKVNLPNQNTK